MSLQNERNELISAFREYLEELEDTGVDWLELTQARAPSPARDSVTDMVPPPMEAAGRSAAPAESLAKIRTAPEDCTRCHLCQGRQTIASGNGSPPADVLFVGDSPEEPEDTTGEPFAGGAGELLNKMIIAMGLTREKVYITNVLNCRPQGGADPDHDEVATCAQLLLRQIQSIAPKVIITLGAVAFQTLLGSREPTERVRGRFHDYHGIPLMPTFHPTLLLSNPEKKRDTWNDLQQVMKMVGSEAS